MSSADGMEVRAYEPTDRAAVLELMASSLGWMPDDQHGAFFSWKHEANPFGPSLAWVAIVDGALAGFRTFLRWEFVVGAVVRRPSGRSTPRPTRNIEGAESSPR